MTLPEVILPPTRSPGTAAAAFIATIIVVTLAIALIADPAVTDTERVAIGLLGALFAGTLGVVGMTLMRGHGALLLDVPGKRLGLGVTRQRDTWWLSLADVRGLAVVPIPHPSGETIERWMLLLSLARRPEVVLAESDDRNAILGIRERLCERLVISEIGEGQRAERPTAFAHETRFAVARGAALQGLLSVFGASLIAFGAISFTELQREPVAGFIFAPILVVMGVALLAVPLVKRFSTEVLSCDGRRWTHAYTFARWRWAERTVTAPAPLFRIRLLGMRGGMLELIGEDGMLILAAGATAHSRLDLEAVAAIPGRFAPKEA